MVSLLGLKQLGLYACIVYLVDVCNMGVYRWCASVGMIFTSGSLRLMCFLIRFGIFISCEEQSNLSWCFDFFTRWKELLLINSHWNFRAGKISCSWVIRLVGGMISFFVSFFFFVFLDSWHTTSVIFSYCHFSWPFPVSFRHPCIHPCV